MLRIVAQPGDIYTSALAAIIMVPAWDSPNAEKIEIKPKTAEALLYTALEWCWLRLGTVPTLFSHRRMLLWRLHEFGTCGDLS
jgi:hypothetical protein